MSRRRRSDYRLSLGWILGVTFIGTLTRLKLPQWSSLSFGAAVCLRLPPHTTSQRKLSRLATDHATCSCLRLTVATNSPRKGLSPPIQCPCRAHQRRASLLEIVKAARRALTALLMPFIILGGILGGVFTPTEAAAVAVAYALFLGFFIYRNLTVSDLAAMLVRTGRITGVIFVIVAFAAVLGWWISFNRIPQEIAAWVIATAGEPWMILTLIIIVLLAIGMIMDITAILIILAPILVPLTLEIGMEPIHAGIVFVLALNISLMTPPVGACLFVLASVTGERIENIALKLWPFLIAEVAILLLIAFWEWPVLFLPRLLGFG